MVGDRRWEIPVEGDYPASRLCQACCRHIGVTGAGISLMAEEGPRGTICTTDSASALIEELQYTLGEGPCVDVYRDDVVVAEPDLLNPEQMRWPAFTPRAVDAGVRAIFGFPLRVAGVRLGVLDLYMDRAGPLRQVQYDDALVVAEAASQWLLDMQAGAPPGMIAEEVQRDGDFHFIVQNAAGMVSVQLGVSVGEALVRLRAHAFRRDRSVKDVALDVVDRILRFDDPVQ